MRAISHGQLGKSGQPKTLEGPGHSNSRPDLAGLARLLARQAARDHHRRPGFGNLTTAALLAAASILIAAILLFVCAHLGH